MASRRIGNFYLLILAFALALAPGCTRRKTIWIYTSFSKETIEEMVGPLQAGVPQAEVHWLQNTSEAVIARLNSELEAGESKADLVITGDPLAFEELREKGRLLAYESPAARDVPANWVDPEHYYAAVRLPVVVLAYNAATLKPGELPERWKDLLEPRWANKVSMPNPLDSPSAYVSLALLSKGFGWEYFAQLRKLNLVAEGNNGSVLNRVETGDRPVGILQLDTVLRAVSRRMPVRPIYPLDGAIPVPSPIAILKSSAHPEIARKVYDWFFSSAAQTAIVHSGMYSPLPKMVSPDDARPWSELQTQLFPWSARSLREMYAGRDQIRAKFSEVVLH